MRKSAIHPPAADAMKMSSIWRMAPEATWFGHPDSIIFIISTNCGQTEDGLSEQENASQTLDKV